MISLRTSGRFKTTLLRVLGAVAVLVSAMACKSEENLRLWGDGSGGLEIRLTIENDAASALDEARRELERRGFTISRQTVNLGQTAIHATRRFSTVEELNEAPDSFRLEVERNGPLRRTFRFHHVSGSQPSQVGFSRVVKVTFPVPVRSASSGTIAGRSVVWDGSSGGSLSVEASGYALPFGRSQSLLFWAASVSLLLGLVVAAKLRSVPPRRCGNCHRSIDLAVRFCPACGTANDVEGEEGGVRSVRMSRAVPALRLLARALSLTGLGVVLFLSISALPAELAPATSLANEGTLARRSTIENRTPEERSPTQLSPESFLAGGAFDLVTGRPKVWYARAANGAFSLFDGPGFDPTSRSRLQPLVPELVAEVEAWAREESERRRASAETQRREAERQEAVRQETAAREEQERRLDRYIDRSALGRTPARRAAVVHVLPNRDLDLDGLALRLRQAVGAAGFESIPLFRPAISRDGVDRELFAGSSSRSLQLRLASYSTMLVMAEVKELRPPFWAQHFYLSEVGLDLRSIDSATGRTLHAASASAKGGGPTREAARSAALDELLKVIESTTTQVLR